MRFHIDTLLGLKPHETQLPLPASEDEQRGWMNDIDTTNIHLDHSSLSPSPSRPPVNPSFPYPDGPGHVNSTPQQLAVMWRMMGSVGVTSFRPDFAESPKSQDNLWLWNLALSIFVKLVECGEYSGVSLAPCDSPRIHKSLFTYVGSLQRRSDYNFNALIVHSKQ